MTIKCDTMAQFMECVSESVQAGLMFTANADTLIIVYSGGY